MGAVYYRVNVIDDDPDRSLMSADALARARDLYLSERGSSTTASPMIVASWQRSLDFNVDMRRLRAPYRENPNLDVPLMRAARPVLDTIHQVLANEPISTMVTDKDGLILARDVSHAGMTTRLNQVSLAPGHVFSEDYVGTNGIGTALASGKGAVIKGAEHFVEDLIPFYCTAVPILHPTRRTVMGAFNLTTATDANSGRMALALASSMARQIEDEVGRISSQREYLLFERYMAACRGTRPMPVLALNDEVTMMNDKLRTALLGADQEALLSHAREMLGDPLTNGIRSLTLPSGRLVELRSSGAEDAHDGGRVFQVRVVRHRDEADRSTPIARPVLLPDVVGSMPSWVRAISRLQSAYAARVPTAVVGESGIGKVHVITAVHRTSGSRGSTIVLESPVDGGANTAWLEALGAALADPEQLVIVRNTHWMDSHLRDRLASLLLEIDLSKSARLFMTMQPSAIPLDDSLAARCDEIIELPPVRHRQEDLSRLIRYFARRYRPTGDLTFTTAAEQVLAQCAWPDNVRQVESVVLGLARQRSIRTVRVEDLPPECRISSRMSLTVMEVAERDTILRALLQRDGNIHQTAKQLGIARATMYRKMRRYGIDPASL